MKILLPSDAARAAGVSAQTVRTWIDAGRLPAMRTAGGRRVIREDDLRAYLKTRQKPKDATGR